MLKCIECGATVDDHTPNWRAYIAEPDENDNGEFVVTRPM